MGELIPGWDPQEISYEEYIDSFPKNAEWKYNNDDLDVSEEKIRRLILMLIKHIGLFRFIEFLPIPSRNELKDFFLRHPKLSEGGDDQEKLRVLSELFAILNKKKGRRGKVLQRTSLKLNENEHVFIPDIVFVEKSKVNIIKGDCIHGVPSLIIELFEDPSITSSEKIEDNMEIYKGYGVNEVWVVDMLFTRTIFKYALKNGSYEAIEDSSYFPELVFSF